MWQSTKSININVELIKAIQTFHNQPITGTKIKPGFVTSKGLKQDAVYVPLRLRSILKASQANESQNAEQWEYC